MAFGGFEVGQVYNRQRDIHGRFKGQERGGIATPANHPLVIAFTGETGTAHGYEDGWTPEGVYRYFGEGQHGDMAWKAGNVAIRDHTTAGKDLLLFQILGKGQVRFLGEFFYAGYEIELAPDTDDALRQAFVFNLVPLESLSEASAPEQPGDYQDDLPARVGSIRLTQETTSENKSFNI